LPHQYKFVIDERCIIKIDSVWEKMPLADAKKSHSETFIVWNDSIMMVGSFIPDNEGKATVCGTINFKTGGKLSFSSQQDDRKTSRDGLMLLCRFVAKLYGATDILRKIHMSDSPNENAALLKKGRHLLN
jgi:hypothetical protein